MPMSTTTDPRFLYPHLILYIITTNQELGDNLKAFLRSSTTEADTIIIIRPIEQGETATETIRVFIQNIPYDFNSLREARKKLPRIIQLLKRSGLTKKTEMAPITTRNIEWPFISNVTLSFIGALLFFPSSLYLTLVGLSWSNPREPLILFIWLLGLVLLWKGLKAIFML